MCIIIYKPAGQRWPDSLTLEDAFSYNQDGFGLIARTKKGKVRTLKGMFEPPKIQKILDQTAINEPAIAHWRFATHGATNKLNCHPFAGQDWYLAHNGVLPNPWSLRSHMSDTRMFVDAIRYTPFNELKKSKVLLEDMIGSNRVTIMSQEGELLLLNEEQGLWEDGLWYSNNQLSYDRSQFASTTRARQISLPSGDAFRHFRGGKAITREEMEQLLLEAEAESLTDAIVDINEPYDLTLPVADLSRTGFADEPWDLWDDTDF